ncbi:protein FAM234B isoform X2 [Ambystoma mexicanum]|uniref:protein FAM234B isoform X2 n=1 Tax=Ambystoma mexicanum TaxID=8296 RepID=UPI0037E7F43F
MATVLSRALKLPGKKNHDLGEYDPLTQADSDESEDDLVINIQKNGLKNGKSIVQEGQDADSDVEVGQQKINHRVSKNGSEGLSLAGASSSEQKVVSSMVPCLRTTISLLTVVITMVLVLVCAFVIPCPQKDLLRMWTFNLGQGVLSPLELFDVNNDGVPDILLSFRPLRNDTTQGASRPILMVVALSGVNGSVLWTSTVHEEISSIQCGRLTLASHQEPTCLLTGTSKLLRLVNASSGKSIWTMHPDHVPRGMIKAQALILPDLDGDDASDLLMLMGDSQPTLTFLLVSGKIGKPLGGPVKYNVLGNGKLIVPQVHVTNQGTYYILFGLGNVQAVALRDIFAHTKNRDRFPQVLQKEDQDWENRRSVNQSKLIDVFSGGVEFLQLVTVPGNNCSDLLITTKQGISLLSGQDLEPRWTLNQKNIQSQPAPGFFNEDQHLDFMLEAQSGDRRKKVLVINGETGASVWNATVPWQMHESKTVSVLTADMKSVFLYWGEEPHPASNSSFAGRDVRPRQHLYLLHPTYPSVLLDIINSTASVTASAIGINDLLKDAFYVTVTAEYAPGTSRDIYKPMAVNKIGLRWGMANSNVMSLGAMPSKIKPGDVRRILSRLKFVNQNQKF